MVSCTLINQEPSTFDSDAPVAFFTDADILGSIPVPVDGRMTIGFVAIVILDGGEPGKEFVLTSAFVFPDGRQSFVGNRSLVWPLTRNVTLVLPVRIRTQVDVDEVEEYPLRFLVDGSPVGETRLVLFRVNDG